MENSTRRNVLAANSIFSPDTVRVVRTLGQGRAATAQLVDATIPGLGTVRCVEKVFQPGWLTRLIYRCGFQAPFAYQSNRDAILASFYRRRVAATVLEATGAPAAIAKPLYVRYDKPAQAWVLAAEWIDGRGIRPAPCDDGPITGWLRLRRRTSALQRPAEIKQLIAVMAQLERLFRDCGLSGSGWQVAPRAIVSTANLLRVGDHYTVIDLESGIPAILVPSYLLHGLRKRCLPPFDDLDAEQLLSWTNRYRAQLESQFGCDRSDTFRRDVRQLIRHSRRWKNAEPAVFRRPGRWLTRTAWRAYTAETRRRWQQTRQLDRRTDAVLWQHPVMALLIWLVGLIPFWLGRTAQRLLGNRHARKIIARLLRDNAYRNRVWTDYRSGCAQRWADCGRTKTNVSRSSVQWALHRGLECLTPSGLHRWMVDPQRRREFAAEAWLLLTNSAYQSMLGKRQIESSIKAWESAGRIDEVDAAHLRREITDNDVLVYARGFGLHVSLEAIEPILVPIKVGGIAAFASGANLLFLLPLALMPLLRTCLTLWSAWTTRSRGVAHAEALVVGVIPMIGPFAFPFQMFARRPDVSKFMLRDAASKLGRRIPIYGGADTRTEIAFIRWTDVLIEAMTAVAWVAQQIRRRVGRTDDRTAGFPLAAESLELSAAPTVAECIGDETQAGRAAA